MGNTKLAKNMKLGHHVVREDFVPTAMIIQRKRKQKKIPEPHDDGHRDFHGGLEMKPVIKRNLVQEPEKQGKVRKRKETRKMNRAIKNKIKMMAVKIILKIMKSQKRRNQ